MSHFKVLVIGTEDPRELDDVLAPYDEHVKFPPYIKFTREDKAAERKRLIKYYEQQIKLHPRDIGLRNKLPDLYITDEKYFENATKYYDLSAQNTAGEPISTYNPNSKWSSWKYVNLLPRRRAGRGVASCCCEKREVDWAYIAQIGRRNAEINWPKMAQGCSATPDQNRMLFDYYSDETKIQYVDRKSLFMTHAYILHGKWYEKGKIGWWGETEEEMDREKWVAQYAKMLREVKPNTVLTTIDCHI